MDGQRSFEWELLAPAGSPEALRAVIDAGADAVYLGGSAFGARAYADNFNTEELLEAIDYAHLRGKRIYLTVNTLLKEKELREQLPRYLAPFYEQGVDAVLVQDLGVLSVISEAFPGLPIHASTQMTVTGIEGVRFLQQLGVTRTVMARELSLEEMGRIRRETGMELEAFVHGALCYCYSGQCLLSSMLGARSGNRGRCAQPCRLPWTVLDEKARIVAENTYILSMKDLCGIEDLPQLFAAGITSLKIEGRMKQAEYAAGVTAVYRYYMDRILATAASYSDCCESEDYMSAIREAGRVTGEDRARLAALGNRCGFTDQYYYRHNSREMITFRKPNFERRMDSDGLPVSGVIKGDSETEPAGEYGKLPGTDGRKGRLAIRGKAVFRKGKPSCLRVEPALSNRFSAIPGKILCTESGVPEVVRSGEKSGAERDRMNPCVADMVLCAEAEGAVPEPAQKKPVSAEELRCRLCKTGDTPFFFESLQLEADEDLFIPNGAVNRLRREALGLLQERLIQSFRRKPVEVFEIDAVRLGSHRNSGIRMTDRFVLEAQGADSKEQEINPKEPGMRSEEPEGVPIRWIAAVSTKEQLTSLIRRMEQQAMPFTQVYLDAGLLDRGRWTEDLEACTGQLDRLGIEVSLMLPYLFREETAAFYQDRISELRGIGLKGFVVRNYEELFWVREHFPDQELVADHGLYSFNSAAQRQLYQAGVDIDTVPLEQNRAGIIHRDNRSSEVILYGRYPLMISAQCIRRSSIGCDRVPSVLRLRDRYRKEFPAANYCGDCYSILYNSLPADLSSCREELSAAGLRCFRVWFTVEGEQEMESVLDRLSGRTNKGRTVEGAVSGESHTYGHYKRGVD